MKKIRGAKQKTFRKFINQGMSTIDIEEIAFDKTTVPVFSPFSDRHEVMATGEVIITIKGVVK